MDERGQTIVVFIRHGETTPEKDLSLFGRERGKKAGEMLKEMSLIVEVVASSPQPRAVQTVDNVLNGMGVTLPADELVECIEFGAAVDGPHAYTSDEIASLREQCKPRGIDLETGLLTLPDFAAKLELRGKEGADMIRELIDSHPGKNILIASHGGSRIEAVLANLLGATLDSIKPFEKSEFVVLRFNHPDTMPEKPERFYPEIETPKI